MKATLVTWTTEAEWRGEMEGAGLGSGVSLIFTTLGGVGQGPRLHRHPYPETFIVRKGEVLFQVGDASLEAVAGQVVVVPAGAPHGFASKSAELEMIDIHASPRFITEWMQPG